LRPRQEWVYSERVFRWFLGPIVLLAAVTMLLPFPGTNSISSFAVFLIALGLLEDDGLFGLAGAFFSLVSLAIAVTVVVLLVVYGPEGIKIVEGWFGR
jgi:hypothetical protein